MALLVCPDCGGNVSSKAAKCPRCGCPVSVMIQEQPNSENQQNTEQQSVEQPQPVEIVKNEEKNIEEQQNSENQQNTEQQSVEQSIQEQPQPEEIVNNEEKIIEEQPKVSVQKEEKVVEPSIRQKSAKEKTNNIIVAVAIIILFGIIIVAGRMSENNEKESSYVPSDNTNSETTSTYNPNVAKVQNPEEATQRLNDFKRKITSSPFEKDAVEIEEIIDNDYAKYIFFLGNITIDDDGDFDYIFGCVYLYNAVTDQLFKLDGEQFIISNINDVSKKKLGWIFDENNANNANNKNNGCNNGRFVIKDYSNKGFCVIQFGNVGDDKIMRLTMSDLHVLSFSSGEILQDKYFVEFDRWGPTIGPLDTRRIKRVFDLFTGKEIENPFTKAGAVNFIGENNTKINLVINKDASVTGNVLYNGKTYKVNNGNQTFDGDINLSIGYTDDGIDCFIIKKEGNKYILLGGFSDVYDINEQFSMEVFKL